MLQAVRLTEEVKLSIRTFVLTVGANKFEQSLNCPRVRFRCHRVQFHAVACRKNHPFGSQAAGGQLLKHCRNFCVSKSKLLPHCDRRSVMTQTYDDDWHAYGL